MPEAVPRPRPSRRIAGAVLLVLAAVTPCVAAEAPLSLRAFGALVIESDETLALRRMDIDIAAAAVRSARGAFEPAAFIQGRRDRSNVLNTAQERLQRGLSNTFDSRVTDFSTGITTRTQTGADIEVAYRLDRYRNNLQPASLYGREHRSVMGVSISQPLLRGAGLAVNRAPTNIAEHDERIARETGRLALQQRLMDAVSAYLAMQEATSRVNLLQTSLDVAESLLRAAERMTEGGMRPEGSVVEAVAFRDIRRVQLEQARQDVVDARAAMRAMLLAGPAVDQARRIAALEPLADRAVAVPPADRMLAAAMADRPETRIGTLRVGREGFRILMAENQALPQLNLTGRYDLDGLSDSARSSVDRALSGPNHVWGVGMELRVPLLGNRAARADLDAARLRRDQAEVASTAARQRVMSDVDATREAALLAVRQLENQRQLVRSQQELLRLARAQAEGGRLSSIELLRRRLDVFQAEEQLVARRGSVVRAHYAIAFAQGRLAAELGLE